MENNATRNDEFDITRDILGRQPPSDRMFDLNFGNPLVKFLKSLPDQTFASGISMHAEKRQLITLITNDTNQSLGTLQKLNKTIVTAAEPTKIAVTKGHESETNARAGKELRNGVHIHTEGPISLQDYAAKAVSKRVRNILFPTAKTITYRFNKIAIYEAGSCEREQLVVPSSTQHKGTLFMLIPTIHQGGNLVLRPDYGPEMVWRSGYNDHRQRLSDADWIAFSTAVPYEIEPILSGVRIVLQFDIYCEFEGDVLQKEKGKDMVRAGEAPKDDTHIFCGDDDNQDTTTKLAAFDNDEEKSDSMEDMEFCDELADQFVSGEFKYPSYSLQSPCNRDKLNGIILEIQRQLTSSKAATAIALPLYHQYPKSEDTPPNRLHSIDRELFAALINANLIVQIVPMLIAITQDVDDDGRGGIVSCYLIDSFRVCQSQEVTIAYAKRAALSASSSSSSGGDHELINVYPGCIPKRAVYIPTLFEQKELVRKTSYNDHQFGGIGGGIGGGELTYLTFALLVMPGYLRTSIEIPDTEEEEAGHAVKRARLEVTADKRMVDWHCPDD